MEPFDSPREAQRGPISTSLAILVLLVLVPLIHGVSGWLVGRAWVAEMRVRAMMYDEYYDPIVVVDGEVNAGPRIVRDGEGRDGLFLVDPERTVPDDAIEARQGMIVRRTEAIHMRGFERRVYDIGDVQRKLGVPSLRIDSASLTAALDAYTGTVGALVAGFFVVMGVVDLVWLPLCAGLVSWLVGRVLGPGLSTGDLFPIALLFGVSTVPVRWGLWGLGVSGLGYVAVLVWPTLMGLGTLAVGAAWRRR